MVTEAQKRAKKKYDKENMTQRVVRFSPREGDLLAHLDAQSNKSGYIKQLIRQDMEGDASRTTSADGTTAWHIPEHSEKGGLALSLPPATEAIMDRLTYQAFLTPEEEGGYSVCFPDLDGCYTCGDDFADAVDMAADAAKTFVAALMKYGDPIPEAKRHDVPNGDDSVWVSFEADPSYIVDGEVVSAAQAARDLNVSPGRISHMLKSGLLDGYRSGRRTYVTRKSIDARLASPRAAGRPKKAVTA